MPPHDDRIIIRMPPTQITNLRNVLQKLERYPRLQALLGLTYEEIRAARDSLERLPMLITKSETV